MAVLVRRGPQLLVGLGDDSFDGLAGRHAPRHGRDERQARWVAHGFAGLADS